MAELLQCEPASVVAFSDYGGDTIGAYEVFATYVTAWDHLARLEAALEGIRSARGISDRTVDFKGRKDSKKAVVLRGWLAAFRSIPGLAIALCFDKRHTAFKGHHASRRQVQANLREHGINVKTDVAYRLGRALSFIGVVGRLLRPTDKMFWSSDRDKIFAGGMKDHVGNVMESIMRHVNPTHAALKGYAAEPLSEQHRLALSLPDLLAGTMACGLPVPITEGTLPQPADVETTTLINAFGRFSMPDRRIGTPCRLLVVVFSALVETETYERRVLTFNQIP
ncbi:MAG: hypothetical protein JWM53_1887 [bacterium]|nr:hypothetical protein [bacterium]